MKVVYFSKSFFADCDFPLVKELQSHGVDVHYYIPITRGFKNSSILEFSKPWNKWGIYNASNMEEMQAYKDCLDLKRLYFISGYSNSICNPFSWFLWFYVLVHVLHQRADVLHFAYHLGRFEKLLLFLPFGGKRVMTVHDPIQHSGKNNYKENEKARKKCFKWADDFILLSSNQVNEFCEKYKINKDNIKVSHLGVYDTISHLQIQTTTNIKKPYIIFFGLIYPYKGLEYLLESMLTVHEKHPELSLLIAGKGNLYFDMAPYEKLDYIIWENHYIGIRELASYIRGSLFAVCPYKDATQSGVIQTAFALETPVIATNVGDFSEIVKDGLFGKIVPACEVNSLSNSICEMLDRPNMIEEMKLNISKIWMPSMSWGTIADDYISVYTRNE